MNDYPTVAFNLGAGYIDDAKVNALAKKALSAEDLARRPA